MKTIVLVLVIGGGVLLTGCSSGPEQSVDEHPLMHLNAEYRIAGELVKLENGSAEAPAALGSTAVVATRYFGNELSHDLNGDGRTDTLFILTQDTGGSGVFFYLVAALDRPGGVVGTEGMFLGDRIAPQPMSVGPGGDVVVNFAERAPGESFAEAPSVGRSMRLRLDPELLSFGEVVEGFADPSRMTLTMYTWRWIQLNAPDGSEITPRDSEAFTVRFGRDGNVAATTDCNRVSGAYTVEGTRTRFGDLAATKMYCEGSQEDLFTGALAQSRSFRFTNRGELVLESAAGTMFFRGVRP